MRNKREVTLNLKYALNLTQISPVTTPMWMENSMYFYKTSATGEHKAPEVEARQASSCGHTKVEQNL